MSEPRHQVDEAPSRPPLVGKVATLVNERELVINIGTVEGVRPKMKFRVLAAAPVEVRDPDSGEPLGTIEREKVRVQAIDIQENFTVCQTYETLRRGPLAPAMGAELLEAGGVRTLRRGDRGYVPPITEKESYVAIGDLVEEIVL